MFTICLIKRYSGGINGAGHQCEDACNHLEAKNNRMMDRNKFKLSKEKFFDANNMQRMFWRMI